MLIIVMSVELRGRENPTEERLVHINERMHAALSDVIKAGKQDGTFTSAVSTPELVTVILSVTQGCFLEWYRYGAKMDGQALVRALPTTVLHGVLSDSE